MRIPGSVRRLRRAYPSTIAVLVALTLQFGCGDGKKLKVVGDPCQKADECATGMCDEQVCLRPVPRGPGDACDHPLDCRSLTCLETPNHRVCGPGVRPNGQGCTDPLQCAGGECSAGVCAEKVCGATDAGAPDAGAPDAGE